MEACDPALRPGCGVAFAVPGADGERLVIVHEVTGNARTLDAERVLGAIRAAVAEGHGLTAHAVVLVRQGNVPKTSSGKLERRACRTAFLSGALTVIARWSAPSAVGAETAGGAAPAASPDPAPADPVTDPTADPVTDLCADPTATGQVVGARRRGRGRRGAPAGDRRSSLRDRTPAAPGDRRTTGGGTRGIDPTRPWPPSDSSRSNGRPGR